MEDLLVSFGNEIIFLVDAHKLVPVCLDAVAVSTDREAGLKLDAELALAPVDSRVGVDAELKAVTYHRLEVRRTRNGAGLRTSLVIDI